MARLVESPAGNDRIPLSEGSIQPAYRADVDGLRAVAVLAVIGFHVHAGLLPGGFVGVDIFFVVSGFLISTVIFNGLDRRVFSFAEFYTRRIRRIFPALTIVLAAVWTFGWFYLLPDAFQHLGQNVSGGAGFMSNIVLWRESGYFDRAAEQQPLLHLWSLGVEEQFYLLWPGLMYLSWKRRGHLLLIVSTIGAASFLLNVFVIREHPGAAFYLPLTRLWELLLGSLLALRRWQCWTAQPGRCLAGCCGIGRVVPGSATWNPPSACSSSQWLSRKSTACPHFPAGGH